MTKKCRAIMFKNIKIGTKIALGFAKDFKRRIDDVNKSKKISRQLGKKLIRLKKQPLVILVVLQI